MAELSKKSGFASLWAVGLGIGTALVATLLLVVLFAVAMKLFMLSESAISPVNVCIKVVSICAGVYIGLGKDPTMGWLKGIVTGVGYMLAGFILFGLFGKQVATVKLWMTDIVLGAVAGLVSGVIGVNIRRR